MQLCQIHFYQKIARKKVARVNAAFSRECYQTRNHDFAERGEPKVIFFL